MTTYADAIARIDPSLPLSPYSDLAVAGLRAGFEEAFDSSFSAIPPGDVTDLVQDVVSSVVNQALEVVADIPIVQVAAWVVQGVIQAISDAERSAAAHKEQALRDCQRWERAMRPVGTGAGLKVMPADLLAWYLRYDGERAIEVPENSNGAEMPLVGRALWTRGYGYAVMPPISGARPGFVERVNAAAAEDYVVLRAAAIRMNIVPADAAGPRVTRREQFRVVAEAVASTRNRPETDGGASMLALLLDILLDQAGRVTPMWVRWLTSHYVVREPGKPPRVEGPAGDAPLDACHLPATTESVTHMVEAWRSTLYPVYKQEREKAAALRRDVDGEVRRVMRRLPTPLLLAMRESVGRAVRPSAGRRAALVGAAGAAALALARPDLAASALAAARKLL